MLMNEPYILSTNQHRRRFKDVKVGIVHTNGELYQEKNGIYDEQDDDPR